MTFLQVILLSLLQGATEFLPISSSGHLVLARALFSNGVSAGENVAFVVLVHFGTLLAIGLVFRGKLARLIRFFFCDGWRLTRQNGLRQAWVGHPSGRLILAILLTTFITGPIGLIGNKFFKEAYENPQLVGILLCVTAALLLTTFRRPRTDAAKSDLGLGDDDADDYLFPFWIAIALGFAQAFAILPGISRSGTTIAVALLLGLGRRRSFDYSFLIALPAIFGAMILELPDLFGGSGALAPHICLTALAVSAGSGWVFLKLLQHLVLRGSFGYWALYCLPVGVWAIVRFA